MVDNWRDVIRNARALAVENIQKKQRQQKQNYDESHRHIDFQVGDQVKVFFPIRKVGRSEKLFLRNTGPHTVMEKVSDVNYRIRFSGDNRRLKEDVVHVSRILPWKNRH